MSSMATAERRPEYGDGTPSTERAPEYEDGTPPTTERRPEYDDRPRSASAFARDYTPRLHLVREGAPGAPDPGAADPGAPDPAAPDPAAPDPAALPDLAYFEAMEATDPFEMADEIEELEETIVIYAAHQHAGQYRLLRYVAELDRLRGWRLAGHKDCAAWVHFRIGVQRGAAREWVRTARALRRMPLTGASMARGELSYSKVRCLTRAVDDIERSDDPEAERKLVDFARRCTTQQLEGEVRRWRALETHGEEEVERRRYASRTLWVAPDEDGMYRIQGKVSAEVGALLMHAVDAASDALFREGPDWGPEGGARGPSTKEVTPAQRRADALGLLAERAMAAGFGVKKVDEPEASEEEGRWENVRGDGEEGEDGEGEDASSGAEGAVSSPCSCGGPSIPLSGTRAERYQVMIHVDAETLRGDDPEGRCHLSDGTPVSAETARRLTCDASIVGILRGADGTLLDLGRRTRTISPALRRALDARDGGCRWPGCGLRFIDGHHIVHWVLGGETKLANLVSLCRHHHRCVHEDGFQVKALSDGRFRFLDPTGWPLPNAAPPPPALAEGALDALIRRNRAQGADPDWMTPSATWKREADIPYEEQARVRDVIDPPEPGARDDGPRE